MNKPTPIKINTTEATYSANVQITDSVFMSPSKTRQIGDYGWVTSDDKFFEDKKKAFTHQVTLNLLDFIPRTYVNADELIHNILKYCQTSGDFHEWYNLPGNKL